MRSCFLTLMVYLILPGCGILATEPDSPELLVEVQEVLFVRDPDTGSATIAFSVRNTGDTTIYLSRCGEHLTTALDRWEQGQWVQVSSAICQTVHDMTPFPLHSMAERTGGRAVQHPGRYRLRLGTSEKQGARSRWVVASPTFAVE